MKIAYIFVGHFRTWEKCYENFFQNIYSIAPGDIFINTWDKTNCSTTSWWNNWGDPLNEQSKVISEQVPDFQKIITIYNPNILMINKDPSWSSEDKFWAHKTKYADEKKYTDPKSKSKLAIKYVLQSLLDLFNIVSHIDNYDRIFCLRPDINFISPITTEELNTSGFVTSFTHHTSDHVTQDIFYHADMPTIKIKAEFANHIDRYWYDQDYPNIDFERCLNEYLRDNHVSIVNSSLLFNIPRIDGTISVFNT